MSTPRKDEDTSPDVLKNEGAIVQTHRNTNVHVVRQDTRDAPIVSVSVVSAIFQGISIGTLKFSPIFADTDTLIFLIEKY